MECPDSFEQRKHRLNQFSDLSPVSRKFSQSLNENHVFFFERES